MIEKITELKNHHSLLNLGDESHVSRFKTAELFIHKATLASYLFSLVTRLLSGPQLGGY